MEFLQHWIPNNNEELLTKLYNMEQYSDSAGIAITAMTYMVRDRQFARIDHLLTLANIERMHVGASIGILRSTLPVKDELPHWNQFRDDVSREINARELNPGKLMVGLYR